jgi:phage terminase large subunit GpA-like protein
MVSDLEPLFDSSPAINGILGGSDESDRDTITSRRFPAGSLKVIPAKSPRNLRRITAKILFMDEVDGYEASHEGDPCLLAEKRTMSFSDRKIVIGSTPTETETSRIIRTFNQSDQRFFELPCPNCGSFTFLKWAHIVWEKDQPETARFKCPHCFELIDEKHKSEMIAGGRWYITRPEVKNHAGFCANALTSPLHNARWSVLADEFLRAHHSADAMRVFVNTVLAEGYSENEEQIDFAEIHSRAKDFSLNKLPEEVLTLTAGVDIQNDRFEAVIIGRGYGSEDYVLGHFIIWGSPGDAATWDELDALLKQKWPHPFGGFLGIDAAAIDSGDGNNTQSVYQFCFPRGLRRVMAIKGMGGPRAALQMSKTPLQAQGLNGRVWIVGVDGLKANIYSRLKNNGTLIFSNDLELSFFEQLTSERLVLKYFKGQPVKNWTRIPGRAAECLDGTVYALAAQKAVRINLAERETSLRLPGQPTRQRPTVIKSKWMAD